MEASQRDSLPAIAFALAAMIEYAALVVDDVAAETAAVPGYRHGHGVFEVAFLVVAATGGVGGVLQVALPIDVCDDAVAAAAAAADG